VTSHFLLMVLFAFLVSTVFAALLRDDPRSQIKTGGWMFGAFVATGVVLGWLLYPLPL
jgi:heme A synthase